MSEGPVDRFYSRWSGVYDHLARRTPGLHRVRARAIEGMALTGEATVVDMGCGPGPNFAPLRAAVGAEGTVIGVDLASGALARARRHVVGTGWPNVHVLRGDARRPPMRSADAILATFVLGMFAEPAAVVERWCRLVGPGGRIGLIHFAKSDRPYGVVPNALLGGLVFLSTPGSRRDGDATDRLDRRVRAGQAALAERCDDIQTSTHWAGLLHVTVGRVSQP